MPRVFISSTFYDFKYARESIGSFVESYGYTPIKFEDGDIGYTPGKELDTSCYRAMLNADMVILIVGGRYGSPTSLDRDSEKTDEFNKYISITRQEFTTAINANIPIFVFIEKNVKAEYAIYKKNKDTLESNPTQIEFSATDNLNVFRFIEQICSNTKLACFEFVSVADITGYLKKQWAALFEEYLKARRNDRAIEEIRPSIQDISAKISEISIMVKELGEKVITNPVEFKKVENNQKIEKISIRIADCFEFIAINNDDNYLRKFLDFFVNKLLDSIHEGKDYVSLHFSDEVDDIHEFEMAFKYDGVIISRVKDYFYIGEDDWEDTPDNRKILIDKLMEPLSLKKMKLM